MHVMLHRQIAACCVSLGVLLGQAATAKEPVKIRWRSLQTGVEYAAINLGTERHFPIKVADRRLHVVRIQHDKAPLVALLASSLDGKSRTAGQWAQKHKLAVVINLGMFHPDHRTHVGYLRWGKHLNSSRWVPSYRSVLAFGSSEITLQDVEGDEKPASLSSQHTVVQNLRLIKGKGVGVWSKQSKRWSEAALAMDASGRLLFIFCRAPLSMAEFNRLLLGLPLGVQRAMHLEGGPEASLSIHAGGVSLDLCGSFETDLLPADTNQRQWPIPNVLGVSLR